MLDDAQVREVVGELAAHAKPGTVIAIHSTISPDTAAELADAAASRRAFTSSTRRSAVVAGPPRRVSWPPWSAPSDEVYERIKPAFKQWASLVIHAGEPGAGTRMKLARNMLTFTVLRRGGRGHEAGRGGGIDLQTLGRVVRHTDALTGGPGAIMVRDDTKPLPPDHFLYDAFTHTRGLGEKDLSLALALGEATGVDLPLAQMALEKLAAGLGVPHTGSTRRSDRWTNCAARAWRR